MSENIKINHYQVTNITANFDKLDNGENSISLSTEVRIKTPKEDTILSAVIEIVVIFKNNHDTILKIINQGFFEFDKKIDEDIVKELLNKNAVPQVYTNTREKISAILEISNIEFVNIPSYSELEQSQQ
jgi:hypothetical protein